jgi:hypothetical protein
VEPEFTPAISPQARSQAFADISKKGNPITDQVRTSVDTLLQKGMSPEQAANMIYRGYKPEPSVTPQATLPIDQGLQQKAVDAQQELELAQEQGPVTEGQFQRAKNAAISAALQKSFAESGGKTLAQEQAEEQRAAAIAARPEMSVSPQQGLAADTSGYSTGLPAFSRSQSFMNPWVDPPRGMRNIMPISGLTADTAGYSPALPFASSIRPRQSFSGIGPLGFKRGGLVENLYQEGGPVGIEGNNLEQEVVLAIMGQHPNPKEVFAEYIEIYGEDGLMALIEQVQQLQPSEGGIIKGEGGGVDDQIPAMIDGQQPARLSSDEYVIPADVVAHAGDGSSDAGGRKFDELVARVRKTKTGNEQQPEQIMFEDVVEQSI